jgi:enoyl-[acyl-carrier protein] reductase/trans-2-enoyl-CoA reductase (NAD+)
MELETFKKLPLGGVDRRALVGLLEKDGPQAARELLAMQRARLAPAGTTIPEDAAVVILGGSNGITRAIAMQLLLAERVPVIAVHYDSAKMQIGVHHVAALEQAAKEAGVFCAFVNRDATRDKTIAEAIELIKGRFRAVHLINGIAAGATKRYAEHGPTQVRDLDVAFDPVLQVPAFSKPEAYRTFGMVDVEVATDTEIERTNKMMGSSSLQWVEPLAEAGLLVKDESVVAFCDYAFEPEDPVYAMGPLAGAKILQREAMNDIRERFGARTVRICYPAMATTALGAIPGGMLMYALTAQILRERDEYRSIIELGRDTMALWQEPPPDGEIRLDAPYQRTLPEFHKRKDALSPSDLPDAFSALFSVEP